MDLLHKCMVSGITAFVLCLSLYLMTINSNLSDDALAWITLVVSAEIGIIITFIVEHNSNKAHQEVMKSQGQISDLLVKLDETDQKHNQALEALGTFKEQNEELAYHSIIATLEYIVDTLKRLTDTIQRDKIGDDEKKLITQVVNHLESPLTLILQALPQTGLRLTMEKSPLSEQILILRELLMTSKLITDGVAIRIYDSLKMNHDELKGILDKINQK